MFILVIYSYKKKTRKFLHFYLFVIYLTGRKLFIEQKEKLLLLFIAEHKLCGIIVINFLFVVMLADFKI